MATTPNVATTTTEATESILAEGYARVQLDRSGAASLENALIRSREFFDLPHAVKGKYTSADNNHGYRPMGIEYSITPDRPDVNEVFTLWSDRLDLIPSAVEIPGITGALRTWRDRLCPLLREIFVQIAGHFGDGQAPEFAASSYLQINNYLTAPPNRDLLQDRHEDGHLITVIHATAAGLEIFPDGEGAAAPITPGAGEVLVMPGSVLTEMTGGQVQPLYHQVRNLGIRNRQAIMYFVNPELEKPLYPWVGTPEERSVDLRDAVRSKPAMFGLPETPEL